jgi:hypothetical protein
VIPVGINTTVLRANDSKKLLPDAPFDHAPQGADHAGGQCLLQTYEEAEKMLREGLSTPSIFSALPKAVPRQRSYTRSCRAGLFGLVPWPAHTSKSKGLRPCGRNPQDTLHAIQITARFARQLAAADGGYLPKDLVNSITKFAIAWKKLSNTSPGVLVSG